METLHINNNVEKPQSIIVRNYNNDNIVNIKSDIVLNYKKHDEIYATGQWKIKYYNYISKDIINSNELIELYQNLNKKS